ncbi:unnamed protein product [Rotaria sp. Silwood2]|nr:unnamed protein product [Rotaria sp. Silwood2]CAF4111979.1 unnamed protein product [Rotaria sp. Silwood2]
MIHTHTHTLLALLQYSPASLDIIDKADASLDMSHIQSIGLFVRKSCRNTQFIIVSLKDGMFSNVNVEVVSWYNNISHKQFYCVFDELDSNTLQTRWNAFEQAGREMGW